MDANLRGRPPLGFSNPDDFLACLITGLAAPAAVAAAVTGHLPPAAAPAVLAALLALGLLLSVPARLAPPDHREPVRLKVKASGEDARDVAVAVAGARVALWLGRKILAVEWLLLSWLTLRRVRA